MDGNPTGTTAPLSSTDDHTSTGERRKNNSEPQGNDYTPTATALQNDTKSRQSAGITESKKITDKLNELDSKKLSSLYKSLCTVSLKEHSALLYAGAWSFFEVLAKNCGNSENNAFKAYYDGKAKEWGLSDSEKKVNSRVLEEISDRGNNTKHAANHFYSDASQLRQDFTTLEKLISSD